MSGISHITQVVQLLLRWGGNPAMQDNFGSTAKSEATKYGWEEIVKLLQREEYLRARVS
jgi:ankyrin repeat protein